jgi:broad specificity polyphosphatase/5'/3'-nucleotidase SurE
MKSDSSDDNHHNGLSWQTQNDFSVFKEGTDAHTVFVKKKVAVTPLSLDLTSRVSLDEIQEKIETDLTD